MLKQIIDFLNLRIAALNYCEELFCLCEIKGESGGDVKQPMQRGSNGEWRNVNFDEFNGVGYWRLRGDVTTEDAPTIVSGKKRLNRTFPLRFVLAVPRDKVTVDDAYSFQRMAVSVEKVVTVQLGDLQLQLGAAKVTVSVNTEKHDPKEVWDAETDNTQTYEPKYELLYGALDMTVVVTADVACFVSECADPDTDILHTFDFCKPTVRERLTDEQVACLEAALCETPPTLCEQLAEVLPADVVADVFDCLTPEAQAELLDSECVIPPCADATITINSDPYGTVPSGGSTNIIVESENNNPLGSLVGGNWEVGNAHLRVNGTTVGNLEPEQWHDHYATINGTQAGSWHNPSQTWRMNVLQGGSPVGSLSGTDWVVPPCTDATAVLKNTANTTISTTSIASGASQNITAPDATAVLKNTANTTLLTEAIPSNVSENITAPDATITLNGSAYGSAPSGTTFNVVATAPSLSLSTTTSTPAYGASFTITATPSGFTPTSYTFHYVNDVNGNRTSTTQTGSSLALTAIWNGAQTIIVTASDSVSGATATSSISITVSNGLRIPTWILNTAPPGSATGAITQVGDLFGFQNNGGNNGNCYAAGMTGACGVVWQPIGAVVFQIMGLSPNITYAGNQQQELDPAWDWQVGGPFGNYQMYVQDNNSYVNLNITTYNMYWWRMDRASNGTIRLYRGTSPDACNTLVHTFSLTNTGTLYPKFYDRNGMRYGRAYIYGS